MTKALSVAMTIFLLAFALLLGKQLLASKTVEDDVTTMGRSLSALASDINSDLPMMIDTETRLDRTMGGPGLAFTYFLTLPSYSSGDVDPKEIHASFPQHKAGVCSARESRPLLSTGTVLHYIYRGNDGAEITRTSISPSDCGISL